MRYGRAVVWLLTGILAGMSPTVQTVEAAEAAAQSKPPASSAAQGADGKTNTAGTAMDEAAWEAALAAGATVSAVHGTVTPDPAAAQATPDASAAAGKADVTPAANAGAAQAERTVESPTANEKSDPAQAAVTSDGGAAMQQVQPAQQMQQESAVVQMTPPEVQAAKTTAVPNAPARVQEIMQKFRLSGNPRSGAYSWVYTSPTWTAEAVSRPAAGSSYFLLAGSENLRFQSFDCDEVWYFHEGCGMRLTALLADGAVRTFELGVGGAANAINPIPGLDIGVDAGLCLRMMADMRARFGLSKDAASKLRHYDVLVPLVKKVFDFATKEGVMIVLKSFGKRYLGKTTAKYVPFIGQGIAAAAGYGMMRWFARQYIEDCYELARLARENAVTIDAEAKVLP